MAVEIAPVSGGDIQTKGDGLSEEGLEVDIGLRADSGKVDIERSAQGFVNGGLGQQESVRPQGSDEFRETLFL